MVKNLPANAGDVGLIPIAAFESVVSSLVSGAAGLADFPRSHPTAGMQSQP